jgi:hypothetical protein
MKVKKYCARETKAVYTRGERGDVQEGPARCVPEMQ